MGEGSKKGAQKEANEASSRALCVVENYSLHGKKVRNKTCLA